MRIPPWTEKETEEKVSHYLVRTAAGDSDEDIRDELSITRPKLQQVKKEATSREVQVLRDQKPEEMFVSYRRDQMRLVKRLEDIAKTSKEGNQPAPQVAAVRAISDLYDRVIKTGQDMGVVEKVPDRSQVAGAFIFSDMSDAGLRKFVAGIAGQAAMLQDRYGSQNITEIEPGVTHYDLPSEGASVNKHNRTKTARVMGGRRKPAPKVEKQKALR
ncbi:hypothetical protein LCGC14_0716450 [marine sediment metagenome]|uniref:Uncharacterized protein n=1 Tax=marine sediment metagenome TaxID=412755 RepID=A0A0F9TL25_9ZZZZ